MAKLTAINDALKILGAFDSINMNYKLVGITVALINLSDHNGLISYGLGGLSGLLRISKPFLKDNLDSLVSIGIIRVVETPLKKGKYQPITYQLMVGGYG